MESTSTLSAEGGAAAGAMAGEARRANSAKQAIPVVPAVSVFCVMRGETYVVERFD